LWRRSPDHKVGVLHILTFERAVTKSELIANLTQRYPQLSGRDVGDAVNTIIDALVLALAGGQRIEIRGFGSFSVSVRAPRVGRNPKSGENVLVPSKQVPHFKAGKGLRERVDPSLEKNQETPAEVP